jgi:hypothetical protein
MATYVHRVATTSTTDGTTYTSASFTPTIEDHLIVFVYASDTTATGTCTSSQGTTFSLVRRDGATHSLYVFIANELELGLSQTITFDCTGDAATGAIIAAGSIQGGFYTGLQSIRQSQSATFASGATPSVTLDAGPNDGNIGFFAVGNATNPATMSAPFRWSEQADVGYGTPTTGFEYARIYGFSSKTVSSNSTSGSAGRATLVEYQGDRIWLPRTVYRSGGVI